MPRCRRGRFYARAGSFYVVWSWSIGSRGCPACRRPLPAKIAVTAAQKRGVHNIQVFEYTKPYGPLGQPRLGGHWICCNGGVPAHRPQGQTEEVSVAHPKSATTGQDHCPVLRTGNGSGLWGGSCPLARLAQGRPCGIKPLVAKPPRYLFRGLPWRFAPHRVLGSLLFALGSLALVPRTSCARKNGEENLIDRQKHRGQAARCNQIGLNVKPAG